MNEDNYAFDELIVGGLHTFLLWLVNEIENTPDLEITLDGKVPYKVSFLVSKPNPKLIQPYNQIILLASPSVDIRYDQITNEIIEVAPAKDTYIGYIEVRDISDNLLQIVGSCEEITFIKYFYLIKENIKRVWPASISTNQGIEAKDEEATKKQPPKNTIPKKDERKAIWKQAYSIILETKAEHLEIFLDNRKEKRSPTIADFQDAIADKMKETISDRTIRKIIKVGDAGLLE
ncbi:hypothetical protein ACFLV7_04245 [Chloroflexota bacterium]